MTHRPAAERYRRGLDPGPEEPGVATGDPVSER
jgi:hypothetical protein